ncbi:putative resolvase [Gluconacetobacter diazotrophicus PA1 5]|uniref:Putative resolvase n=1 Tax=Gluconacetobacter diazotrophicus (strain ATCC 49037 / DSM 5601 / CCUG 37298 / CIP 103539 / LMG 7603 / PAl5) TaxID=272568 RepID=A9HCV0_GLUDA|nr:putative resolvase [Gluconacetobacter diazotrophicus PA1 5]
MKEQEDALAALGVPKASIFKEKISGVIRSDGRPQFGRILRKIQSGDELVVMKLDRLGRSTLDILTVIQTLRTQGVAITIHGVGTIRDDMMGSLTMNLLASFAEFERAIIIDRTQSGRRRAIASGVKMGRKPKLSKQARKAIRERYGNETGALLAKEYGVGLRTIQRVAAS